MLFVLYFFYFNSISDWSKDRWINTINIFNENLSMTNYSIILLRKSICAEEPEIFLTEELVYER